MGNQELIKIFGTPLNSTEMAAKISGIKLSYFALGVTTVGVLVIVCIIVEQKYGHYKQGQSQGSNHLANDQTASLGQ